MHDIIAQLAQIRAFRLDILNDHPDAPLFRQSTGNIRRVIIINSASRSGSSLLYALLGRLPNVVSLTGEAAPFYKLNSRIDRFDPHASDRIPSALLAEAIDFPGLTMDIFSDLYRAQVETETASIDPERYAADLMLRTALQWTDLELDRDRLYRCIVRAFERYAAHHPRFDTEEFYLELLEQLIALSPQINPFYYDIGTDKVALRFPFLDIPSGPPVESFTIEEPPFILLPPGRRAGPAELAEKTLLLKSTVDCYRMNLVERLFPQAEIKVIHLVRNPAATVNGLFDGWHHRGFFSHNLATSFSADTAITPLNIRGYSDLYPFGTHWWNFDLPDGWQAFADRELIEVCAFQWRSANAEILAYLDRSRRASCTVHFEEIIRSASSRQGEFERLLDFMGVPPAELAAIPLHALPVVQSTLPPQLYRWKKRQDLIGRLLEAPEVREMTARLGYNAQQMEEWL